MSARARKRKGEARRVGAGEAVASASRKAAFRDAAVVFVAAFAVRLAVWLSIRRLPVVRSPQLDSLEYLEWARRIAAGDFTWPAPPPHGPGYPYVLGLILAVTGSLAAAAIVQAAVGAGTCVAVAHLGRRFFGRGAGLLGGLLLAVCGVAAFLDVSLYSEGLLLFFATCALAVVGREEASWRRAAAAGALVGAAAIVRPTALVLLPMFAWTFFRRAEKDGGRKRALALAAVTFATAAAFVAPVTIANLRATGAPLLVQGHGGFNFFIGNSPSRDGLPSVRPGGEWDRLEGEAVRHGALSAAAQDRYFVRKTLAEIAASPLSYARLLAMKALWTIQADEVRDPFSFAFFRQEAPILRFLPGLGLLFPLAAAGALAAVRSRPRPALLFAAAGAWLATDILLVTSFRYRAPVLPILAVFAANGVVLLSGWMRTGWKDLSSSAWRERLLPVGGLVAAAVAARLAVHAPSHRFAEEWSATGFALNHERDFAGAEQAFRKAIAADRRWSPGWAGLGVTEANRGDTAAAERDLAKAIAIEPGAVMPSSTLADIYERTGRPARAESEWRRLLSFAPREPDALAGLARTLLAQGRASEAVDAARLAVGVSPRASRERLLLARGLGALHRVREALVEAQTAAELDPGDADAWFTLGMLRLDAGNPASAREALSQAERAGANARRLKLALIRVLRTEGDYAGAERAANELIAADPSDSAARNLLAAVANDQAAASRRSTH